MASWLLMKSFHLPERGRGGEPGRPWQGYLHPPHRLAPFLGRIGGGRLAGQGWLCVSVTVFLLVWQAMPSSPGILSHSLSKA